MFTRSYTVGLRRIDEGKACEFDEEEEVEAEDGAKKVPQIMGKVVVVKQKLLRLPGVCRKMKPRLVLNHMSLQKSAESSCCECTPSKPFRLLCSREVAGGLIVVGGGLVKSLEEEIRVAIRISEPVYKEYFYATACEFV
ncbi:hypothetical protein POM88_042431 [Heracleum sosnowskyi]|uniref:Uncharacterized protein n=1 Tax=Heracleum sosnowskyi TaxID=360622 RepID=A0AAD8M968_9APIA|nr:hypothetical protein POM88_042431 [Heracleum sosnowskyi]